MPKSVAHPLVQMSLVGEAIDAGPIAVFVADDNGRYVAVNAFACSLLGYERNELLERSIADVTIERDGRTDPVALMADPTGEGRALLRRKDGGELWASYRGGKTTVGGMTLYVAVVWTD